VTGDELRAHCLGLAGAEETFPFGDEVSVFKVAGKMFALSVLDATSLSMSVKCDPDEAVELRATYQAVVPGYHLNKRHWNSVVAGADVPDDEFLAMVDTSYELILTSLTRAARATLGQ
jgi:predicted DNA-binding protein (MmcQ/YjbR family)